MTIICGVDVSKDGLDAVIPGAAQARFANDAAGIEALAAFCAAHGAGLAVMEASGGCERAAYALLWTLGQPCALVNPRQVRCFAQAMGFLEKTDRIDAGMIAAYAGARRLRPSPPPSREAQRLRALVARLSQIAADITVNKQRRSAAEDPDALAGLDEILALLKRQSRRLETEIAALIGADPLWARLEAAFRSVKGVASRTVARLMAELPEIGAISSKAIAKLAGLAPIADDSGRRSGRRSIRGGRAGPRAILFLVARIAARYDPHLAAFHQRLTEAGKPKMVVRIALARKLLVILNAKARDARRELANA